MPRHANQSAVEEQEKNKTNKKKNNNPLSDQMSDGEPVGADILTSINKHHSRHLSSVNSM